MTHQLIVQTFSPQVRSTPSRLGPVYTRRTLCRNYAALCLGHCMFVVALMPLVALQSSVSAWWWSWSYPSDPNSDAGALLLIGFYGTASLSAFVSSSTNKHITVGIIFLKNEMTLYS